MSRKNPIKYCYHSKNRSKYLIKLHIVLATKYRKKLFVGKFAMDLKQTIFEISEKSDFIIDMMEVDKDHIHILVDIEPQISVSSIINKIKSMTTNRMWKQYQAFLSTKYWKEQTLFSDGYFVCSTGDASTETILEYIKNQG